MKPCQRCKVKPKIPGPGRKWCEECAAWWKEETARKNRERTRRRWHSLTPEQKTEIYKQKYQREIETPEARIRRKLRAKKYRKPDTRVRRPGIRAERPEPKPKPRVPWEIRRAYMAADPNSIIKRKWPTWRDVQRHYEKEAA